MAEEEEAKLYAACHGVIVMVNPTKEWTFSYAKDVLEGIPPKIEVMILVRPSSIHATPSSARPPPSAPRSTRSTLHAACPEGALDVARSAPHTLTLPAVTARHCHAPLYRPLAAGAARAHAAKPDAPARARARKATCNHLWTGGRRRWTSGLTSCGRRPTTGTRWTSG